MKQDFERRATPRQRTYRLEGKIRFGTHTARVAILDVSREGLRIAMVEDLKVGAVVNVSMLGTDISAIVRWINSDHAGLELAQSSDRNTLIALDTAQRKIERARQDDPS